MDPDPKPQRPSALPLALLVGALTALALADASPEQATLFGVEGPRCPSRWVFPHHGCPGCGLTRASALVLDGEWRTAWGVHPAGFALVGLGLGAVVLHLGALVRGEKTEWTFRLLRGGRVLFLVAVVAAWLAR
ncbi:MAG: DUF2752 domain-containing protein [Planctomycetota bacterium]